MISVRVGTGCTLLGPSLCVAITFSLQTGIDRHSAGDMYPPPPYPPDELMKKSLLVALYKATVQRCCGTSTITD